MKPLLVFLVVLTGCPLPSEPPPPRAAEPAASRLSSPASPEDLDPADDVLHVALVAAPDDAQGYAYNGQVPGPTLIANVGDTLIVDLTNELDTATTIHWHGVHVPWEMDGVPWMMDPVAPGASTTLTFPLTVAGTFWYHPHFDTEQQVDLGLYGALVVRDPDQPAVDEVVLVFDDPGELDDTHAHGSRLPSEWMVNGLIDPTLEAESGAPLRGRLVNASNLAYLALEWPGLRVIGGDQGLLSEAAQPARLVLAPGDRAEVEWSVGFDPITVSATPWTLHGGSTLGEQQRLFTIDPVGASTPPPTVEWAADSATPTADPGHTDLRYVFQGDGEQWMINGELFPDVTIAEVERNSDVIIELRNVSPTRHPFHLHGHSFEVLSDGDGPSTVRRIEDTVDVGIREVVRLRLVADNPGDWMVHCHLLPHADDGMMTVLRVLP